MIGVLTNEIVRLKRLLVAGDFTVSSEIRELANRLKDLSKMSTKTDRDVAHDEQSKFFIFRP